MAPISPLFFLSVFLDLFSVALVVPLLHLYVDHLGVPRSIHGVYQAIYGVMQTLSTPILGTLSDHVGRRPILVSSLLGSSAAYYTLLAAVLWRSGALFIASRFMIGGIRQTMSTGAALVAERYADASDAAFRACPPLQCAPHAEDTDDEAERKLHMRDEMMKARRERETARGLSRFQSAAGLGFVVGPGVGGWLADSHGIEFVTLLAASVNVANAALMYATSAPSKSTPASVCGSSGSSAAATGVHDGRRLSKGSAAGGGGGCGTNAINGNCAPAPPQAPQARPRSNPVVLAFSVVRAGGPYSALLCGMFFFSLAYVMIQSMLALMMRDTFNVSARTTGLLISASAGINAAFQAFALPPLLRRFPMRGIVTVTMWLTVAGYTAQTFSRDLVTFSAGAIAVSLVSGTADTLNKSRFSSHFASDRGGEIMSIAYSIDGANRVIAPLLGSVLLTIFNGIPLVPVVAATASSLLGALLITFLTFDGRRRRHSGSKTKKQQ